MRVCVLLRSSFNTQQMTMTHATQFGINVGLYAMFLSHSTPRTVQFRQNLVSQKAQSQVGAMVIRREK